MQIYSQPYRRTTSRLSVTLTRESDGYMLVVDTLKDAPGTLYRLCAILVRHDWDIERAEISTLENNQVIDRFFIRPASREAVDEIKFEEMMKDFEHLLFENLEVRAYIAHDTATTDAIKTPARTTTDHSSVKVEFTTKDNRIRLTLTGRDRPGLLLDIAGAFAEREIDILEAHIETNPDHLIRNDFLINPTDARFHDSGFQEELGRVLERILQNAAEPPAL